MARNIVTVEISEDTDLVLLHDGTIVAVLEIGTLRELSPGRTSLPIKGHPVLLREPHRAGWRRLTLFGTSLGIELEDGGDVAAVGRARRP